MIQLATDPNASRMNWRPAANDGKANPFDARRRTSHPWPFLSRAVDRPTAKDEPKTGRTDGGS